MKRYGLYLSELQVEKLERLSEATDLSVSEHIRRAVDDYLQKPHVAKYLDELKENDG